MASSQLPLSTLQNRPAPQVPGVQTQRLSVQLCVDAQSSSPRQPAWQVREVMSQYSPSTQSSFWVQPSRQISLLQIWPSGQLMSVVQVPSDSTHWLARLQISLAPQSSLD